MEGPSVKATCVAVTGVTGFTGGALAGALLQRNYNVRVLARNAAAVPPYDRGPEVIVGDLSDEAALAELVDGAEAVFHIAAMYRAEGAYAEFERVNYQGTIDLLEASIRAGVRRFVYCSTAGVHGHIESGVGDENSPLSPQDPYQETKLKAEQAVLARGRDGAIEVVVIRPCAIYGPGDTRMLKMFQMVQRGVFFFVGDAKPNFHPVYIDDLVEGFILASTAPAIAGEVFIVGGERFLPLAEYVATAAQVLAVRPPFLRIPYGPMKLAARICEFIFPLMGKQPPLHRRRLTFFKHNRAFSIDKARRQLGYRPKIDLRTGFERTVAWYRDQGLLN